MFPKIGVPQNGWFIMENPIKIDDLEVPLFLETSKWFPSLCCCFGVYIFQIRWQLSIRQFTEIRRFPSMDCMVCPRWKPPAILLTKMGRWKAWQTRVDVWLVPAVYRNILVLRCWCVSLLCLITFQLLTFFCLDLQEHPSNLFYSAQSFHLRRSYFSLRDVLIQRLVSGDGCSSMLVWLSLFYASSMN